MGDLDAMKREPDVLEVAGTRELPMSVVVSGVERPVNLIGVTQGFQTIRRLADLSRPLFRFGRHGITVESLSNYQGAFGAGLWTGESDRAPIRMGELTFTVIGVFRERVATFGLSEIQKESVIIPLALMKYYTGRRCARVIYAQAVSPKTVGVVQREMTQLLKVAASAKC